MPPDLGYLLGNVRSKLIWSTEAEKRNVLFGKALHIGVLETSGRVEMKMSAQVCS